jgi:hypothetical protein
MPCRTCQSPRPWLKEPPSAKGIIPGRDFKSPAGSTVTRLSRLCSTMSGEYAKRRHGSRRSQFRFRTSWNRVRQPVEDRPVGGINHHDHAIGRRRIRHRKPVRPTLSALVWDSNRQPIWSEGQEISSVLPTTWKVRSMRLFKTSFPGF